MVKEEKRSNNPSEKTVSDEEKKPLQDAQIIQKPIEQEMKTSYLDYAMSVIIGRALPDIRDGLKPVHRRILYAMYDMGMLHNKPFKKSARIVGECFVKDTLIPTTRGLLPIQNIQRDDVVYTQKGKKHVLELYEMPEKELVKIALVNGITTTVTPSQQFKVITEDLNFIWKDAKNLTDNDYVITRSVFPEKVKQVFLGMFHNKMIYLNENIAYLLGQLLSDGWVEKGYNRGHGFRCGFCSTSISIINKIVQILKEEFDYEATVEYKEKKITTSKGALMLCKIQSIRIHCSEINEFLVNSFNLQTAVAVTKQIPQQIFQSPQSVVLALISGMIDGDGSIHRKRNLIHYGSVSEKMINQLQILLQSLGILSRKYMQIKTKKSIINSRIIRNNFHSHTLEIESRFALSLAKQLTLQSEVKAERLRRFKGKNLKVHLFDEIPFAGKIIFEELSKHHLGGGWYKDDQGKKFRSGIKYPTGTKIRYASNLREKYLGRTQIISWGIRDKLEKINSKYTKLIDHIINENIFFIKVKSIEKAPHERTYDIQVEEEHEFIANGVLAHNCLGKYHPHGDAAVYESLVRMAQDFSLRYQLVDGQGNFGSIDGDSAAAMRYTESRMAQLAEELLQDIDKETVAFVDNFDGSLKEPSILPAKFPNLLVNGSSGIAVGMATNIPPHNLGEISEGIIKTIDNPNISTTELITSIKGPDFPTGGLILGKTGLTNAYTTGKGKIKIRAVTTIETRKEREAIIVHQIPYMVNKAALITEIADYVRDKVIEGISDLRDESDKSGLRIYIELKKGTSPDVVLNQLFKHTKLQVTFGINFLAIVDNKPKTLSLKEMITEFVKHRKEVITKRTQYDLRKAEERVHILEGLKIALDNIDAAIALIKSSKETKIARDKLMDKYRLTEIQANAILDMKLQRLTALEQDKIRLELKELLEKIIDFKHILTHEIRVFNLIKSELQDLKTRYNDERRTEITSVEEEDFEVEDLVEEAECVVTITRAGYVKRLLVDTYKAQGRGGKGIVGTTTKDEDVVEHLFIANTHDYLLVFTDDGTVHWMKVFKIPEGSRQARGKAIVNLLAVDEKTKITSCIPIKDFDPEKYLVMITKKGVVKKTSLEAYSHPRQGGIRAITLDEGDDLVNVLLTDGKCQILIATKQGQAVKFHEEDARAIGRTSRGVRGISLKGDDVVIGAVIADESKTLLTVTENGYGKRTPISEYRLINRGGSGVINIQCTERNGNVIAINEVNDEDELMFISKNGIIIRTRAKDISSIGRNTQGVRLMRLEADDKVVAAAKIINEDNPEEMKFTYNPMKR